VEPHPHRFHAETAGTSGLIDDLTGLGRVERERFLAEDRLAGLEACHGVLAMVKMVSGDVDDVDLVVPDELIQRVMSATGAESAGEFAGAIGSARADRGEDGVGNRLRSRVNAWATVPVPRIPHRVTTPDFA
jgi:hypothetical protein